MEIIRSLDQVQKYVNIAGDDLLKKYVKEEIEHIKCELSLLVAKYEQKLIDNGGKNGEE